MSKRVATGVPKPLDAIRIAVKKEVKRQGKTQREVADAVDISAVHLCNMLGGYAWPSGETLESLLDALGLEVVVRRKKD